MKYLKLVSYFAEFMVAFSILVSPIDVQNPLIRWGLELPCSFQGGPELHLIGPGRTYSLLHAGLDQLVLVHAVQRHRSSGRVVLWAP